MFSQRPGTFGDIGAWVSSAYYEDLRVAGNSSFDYSIDGNQNTTRVRLRFGERKEKRTMDSATQKRLPPFIRRYVTAVEGETEPKAGVDYVYDDGIDAARWRQPMEAGTNCSTVSKGKVDDTKGDD